MSTHQGARPDHPEDENMLAGADISLNDIAQSFIMLGEQLREIGTAAYRPTTRDEAEAYYYEQGSAWEADRHPIADLVDADMAHDAEQERITRALSALRGYRSSYYYWERVAVEHATARGFTQRRIAALLGIGVNTVNRWKNNPVATNDDES
ncbi:helix-turn-helix domain-containing protein [Microbacterium sp.]|uniref:helix-turn-helix domain-containing protein n=1 Tax=Microbacterium sp. TaxID=51671 RepID=UPI0039E556FA